MSNSIPELVSAIIAENPSHKPFLDASLGGLEAEEREACEHYLGYCSSRGMTLERIAECYNTIVVDTMREQIYFQRNKRYRHATYADVAGLVYDDPEYMEKYMYGLAVTLFFWPAHRELKRFFHRTLPKDRAGRYLEVGPGHGFYFMSSMTSSSYSSFTGIDISAKSVEMTRDILESGYFGTFTDYEVLCQDFFRSDSNEEPFDALVMGEVLEHVEDPGMFLRQTRALTRPDSYIYVSTCMNAPAVDHLFLFTSPDHLKSIIAEAGLSVVDECLIPYPGLSIEETAAKQLAMNIGLVLKHAE